MKQYANDKGVQILGDIPIYVSADSVDAWVGGPLFELDADGGFARVAGCPPDYFSAEGQLWGNPLYNWPYHKQTGYAWWIQRVRHALGIYDLLRIDHFRGFDTYWAIPADSTTAKHPTVSPDGRWLYFVSDMPGGLGGLDIWRIEIGEHGLGGVDNLGEPINTPGNEMFPSFRPNGDLYFSSDGCYKGYLTFK